MYGSILSLMEVLLSKGISIDWDVCCIAVIFISRLDLCMIWHTLHCKIFCQKATQNIVQFFTKWTCIWHLKCSEQEWLLRVLAHLSIFYTSALSQNWEVRSNTHFSSDNIWQKYLKISDINQCFIWLPKHTHSSIFWYFIFFLSVWTILLKSWN